jgi:two-component system, cell cycle sensor histidine kinase and response regulator CckA
MMEQASAYTILVVDDEEGVRYCISHCLMNKGFNVLLAKDGEEALEIFNSRAAPVHLLISDVLMPGMNGLELAGIISRSSPQTRVIIMSGSMGGMKGFMEGWHFLPKPFLPLALIANVSDVLDTPFAEKAPD